MIKWIRTTRLSRKNSLSGEELAQFPLLAPKRVLEPCGWGLRCKATWKREFKLPWHEAGQLPLLAPELSGSLSLNSNGNLEYGERQWGFNTKHQSTKAPTRVLEPCAWGDRSEPSEEGTT